MLSSFFFFFFNDTATTEIYTLSLHDGSSDLAEGGDRTRRPIGDLLAEITDNLVHRALGELIKIIDRKSTRLNSSHVSISYAVFCLKKKKIFRDFLDYSYHFRE